MSEDLFPDKPTSTLYRDYAVAIAAFIGGPLAAGYILADNFKRLSQPEKVIPTWIISIVVTIAVFAAALFIPGVEKLPNYIVPLAYTFAAHVIAKNMQGPAIEDHISRGGQIFSNWRAVGVSLIGLAIMIAILFAVVLVVDPELPQ